LIFQIFPDFVNDLTSLNENQEMSWKNIKTLLTDVKIDKELIPLSNNDMFTG
jgi:hypothetical protein